jgi:hypothetical protein
MLRSAVAKQPVAVTIDASHQSFHFYKSGVITFEDCGEKENHGVLAVGYGYDANYGPYWLVRNSWGTTWGVEGYFKLGMSDEQPKGFCGFNNDAFYPSVVALKTEEPVTEEDTKPAEAAVEETKTEVKPESKNTTPTSNQIV